MAFLGCGSVGVAAGMGLLEWESGVTLFGCGSVGVVPFGCGPACTAIGVVLGVRLGGVVLGVIFGEWDKMLFLFLDDGVLRAMSSRRFASRCRTSVIVGLSLAGFQHSCMMSYLSIDQKQDLFYVSIG